MATTFISITDKSKLVDKLKTGDKKAISYMLHEIDRLESIIRDYEIGIKSLNDKMTGKTFKEPVSIDSIK